MREIPATSNAGATQPEIPICWESNSRQLVKVRPEHIALVRRDTAVEKTAECPLARDPTPDQHNADGADSPTGSDTSLGPDYSEQGRHLTRSRSLPGSGPRVTPVSGAVSGKCQSGALPFSTTKRRRTELGLQGAATLSITDNRDAASHSEDQHYVQRDFQNSLAGVGSMSNATPPPGAQALALTRPSTGRGRGTSSIDLPDTLPVEVKLPPIPIGAIELLTFFPNHTQWPLASLRLHANDWTFLEVAAVALHARGKLTATALYNRRATLRHQVSKNGKDHFGDDSFTLTWWKRKGLLEPHGRYDVADYKPRSYIHPENLRDESLLACAQGVANWPIGEDCGILTQCVELACDTGDGTLMISEVEKIAGQCGFVQPGEAGTDQWDQNAMRRAAAMLKAYRLDR